VAEARTGTYLQSRGLAQALNDLRSALVQKGKLDKEAAGTASVAGTEGTALISAANLRQGLTPAQSLDRIEAARRLALTGTSKVPAHSTLRAAQGEALELTSPAQLHAGISQAAAIRRLSAFAAASSIGINARGGIVTLKQARGQASVDDSAGTLQAGAAGATFRNAPSAAQTLAALAKRMPGQIRRR
jgi:hypothetical protein